MSLIISLPLQETDAVSVIHLKDPQWQVLKHLVSAQDALRAVPSYRKTMHADRIQTAIETAIEEVAQRLLPDFPELSPEDMAEIGMAEMSA